MQVLDMQKSCNLLTGVSLARRSHYHLRVSLLTGQAKADRNGWTKVRKTDGKIDFKIFWVDNELKHKEKFPQWAK